MSIFLTLAFLFFVGSIIGWGIEVIFRRFYSPGNPERKWINPGLLTGPYLPLYGFSLCALFLLAHINVSFIENPILQKVVLFILMAIVVTFIEYLAGLIFIKGMKIKLWDYSNNWGNIQGIVCPLFSFFWVILCAVYYFLVHPKIVDWLTWLANHLTFSFVMGFFYGIFIIDLCYSLQIMAKVKKFAKDNEIVVKYETLRENIRKMKAEIKERSSFIFSFKSEKFSFAESLKQYWEKEQEKLKTLKNQKKK